MLIRAFRQADLPTVGELLRQLGYEIGLEEVAGRPATALAAPGLGRSGREEGE